MEKEALATIVVNKLRGLINVVAVKAPGFGDRRKALLEDIAILTKGQLVSEDVGLSFNQITLDMLGEARSKIDLDYQTILESLTLYHDLKIQLKIFSNIIK